jgi:hypothetical protein
VTLKELPATVRQKYPRAALSQTPALSPELFNTKNGVGIYFHPAEGQELMEGFNAIVSGLQKHGEHVTDSILRPLAQSLSKRSCVNMAMPRLLLRF